jgi:photosystem II stability/assembly factor-like uncharacterized protein
MKKIILNLKYLFVFILAFSAAGAVSAQTLPSNFSLERNSFEKINSETPLSNGITDIVTDGDIIWLGTSRGISLSTDNGETWRNFYDTPEIESRGISALDYKHGVLWAAKSYREELNGESVQVGGGLVYTTDMGETWTKIPQPIDDPGDSLITYGVNTIRALPVIVTQQNVTFDISISGKAVWITSWAGGLRKTADMGETWQRVVLPPDYLNSIKPSDTLYFSLQPVAGEFGPEAYLNHALFAVFAENDDVIYAGSAGGINRSTDGGVSWTKFTRDNQLKPISGNWVIGISVDQYDGSVWAVTRQAEGDNEYSAISASFDDCESWETYFPNEKGWNVDFKYDYDDEGRIVNSAPIVSLQDGFFRLANDGTTWLSPANIIDSETGLELKATNFYSAASNYAFDGNGYLWLGTNNGLARLRENDQAWSGDWKVFFASQNLKDVSETYAFPNPFSPALERTNIKYTLSSGAGNVTIRIFNFDMTLVKTLIQNVSRQTGIDLFETWDGRNEFGNIVSNGVYFYRIDADGADPIYGKIMVMR